MHIGTTLGMFYPVIKFIVGFELSFTVFGIPPLYTSSLLPGYEDMLDSSIPQEAEYMKYDTFLVDSVNFKYMKPLNHFRKPLLRSYDFYLSIVS